MIFSRKGFDSAAGGCPSPIIDGQPLSMPIPTTMPTPTRFGDLNGPYGSLVSDLTHDRLTAQNWCHLDPDIREDVLPRLAGWRGALGQVAAAQGHLAKQGIQPGDLFIFWGLFRPVKHEGRWKFIGRPEHRIWGWLQVGEIINLGTDGSHAIRRYPWLGDHPHVRAGWGSVNVLYVAADELILGSYRTSMFGYGVLDTGYTLSVPGQNVSVWQVPDWLHPLRGGTGMTCHPLHRWSHDGTVRTPRGQEFVANIEQDDSAIEWMSGVIGGRPR